MSTINPVSHNRNTNIHDIFIYILKITLYVSWIMYDLLFIISYDLFVIYVIIYFIHVIIVVIIISMH